MVQNWVSSSAPYFVYRLYIYLRIHNENYTKWWHTDIWSHPSHYYHIHYSVHLTLVSKRSQSRSYMADSHSFFEQIFMSFYSQFIWKYGLENGGHCVQGERSWYSSDIKLWFYTKLTFAQGPKRTLIKSYHIYDVICEVTVENFHLKIGHNFK